VISFYLAVMLPRRVVRRDGQKRPEHRHLSCRMWCGYSSDLILRARKDGQIFTFNLDASLTSSFLFNTLKQSGKKKL